MKHYLERTPCPCGREHTAAIEDILIGNGVIRQLPELLAKFHTKKPFLLADQNTYRAAGETVASILRDNGIPFASYVFPADHLEPDEEAAGSAVMHFDPSCDLILAVGSGVINDIGKILSCVSGHKYIIVATAPSMDGYASATSSMSMDGLKTSLNTRCAHVILGDVDILKQAPMHMLKAGLGDMLAKYVSIAEWRIAHLITGEYYCEQIAGLIRSALEKCVDNAAGLLRREETAVQPVFEGLVIGGVAMAYAGVSRPASGVEHYFSHVWDMRGLEFGTCVDLHGIQCAMATMKAVELYEALKHHVPNREKAAAAVAAFDYNGWSEQLRAFLGRSGETMIALEKTEGKYDVNSHPARFQTIANNWQTILDVLEDELPSARELAELLDTVGISRDLTSIGVDKTCLALTFKATKDIRDKYVLSRLAWDLGILDDLAELL